MAKTAPEIVQQKIVAYRDAIYRVRETTTVNQAKIADAVVTARLELERVIVEEIAGAEQERARKRLERARDPVPPVDAINRPSVVYWLSEHAQSSDRMVEMETSDEDRDYHRRESLFARTVLSLLGAEEVRTQDYRLPNAT